MTDQFNKLADALDSIRFSCSILTGNQHTAAAEAARILRAAAGVDVAGLMALFVKAADARAQWLQYGHNRADAEEAEAALESALRLVLAQRVPPEAALRELATAKRNLDHESNARNHGSAPEAMLAAMAAKKRFDAAISAVLAAAPQAKEQGK